MNAVASALPKDSPPGPRGLPFLGSLTQMASDPLAFITAVSREHGDVATYTIGGTRFWLVTGPAEIETVLTAKPARPTRTA